MEKGKKTIEENGLGHGTNDHMKMVRKGPGKSAPEMVNNSFPTSVSCSGTNPQKIGADDSGHVRYTENNGSVHVRYTENNGSGHLKPQLKEANNDVQSGTSSQHREKNGNRELIDINVAACKHPMGLDEGVAPQARKLYVELASLWPKGVMDNNGIKRAICHSKERRRALHDRNKLSGVMIWFSIEGELFVLC